MTALPTAEQVWEALARIPDPEIPVVSVVEMGIVRDVQVEGPKATITMTPTFSGCPALHLIREQLEKTARSLGFADVEVKTVLSPPWSTDWITPEAKERLRQYGIAPPKPAHEGSGLIQIETNPTPCPRCGSLDTRLTNAFGPTLCKALYVCHSCKEPFESFKSV
ncbi:MAG: phenylacetate-CoA oxygenase subunit PaaJ [Meiothermus sp.]|uniref:1,2-phenylacetyl-CoA epoxidase subunit PaaD n=1 Tax=Meiothermus sp. TaxID=1955249 RepID=UPI0025DEDE97|nr:1,2-phenylacetyl-CoA epoxidase subunit PaaD [Meiothermus sp.]MCS7059492.1 phenylacetate-CoA oxygenase subunit PaaJ [Meiothermus sp.]MCS7194019.1 phenylacetate-CoA oxygenase subunit PaaJ [Meiothermus sp.]MCX7740953.1 phenylacetate-CoA oxygenase subunit PaaJ [Meiothermus sp.]MDW8090227.1 1,2-phenylacetyl-CoA epoxidase subunit PaaD [Meiothermus sp.]MDW8481195.1 1,2-phenylacetyl-CoA epoxidase subunit PaaD [Meiothermus sp.]